MVETLLTGQEQLLLQQKETALWQNELLVLMRINSRLQMEKFMYTEGKISDRNPRFGAKVKAAYSAVRGKTCWCLLTNDILPKETVIGTHLFKHQWKEQVHLIRLADIDDTRNGLPLWKPIEWAFNTSR